MRITWKNHPHNPSKNGTTEHVSRELASVAVGYEQAVYAPYKSYQERLSEEAREGRDPHNVNPNSGPGISWGVLDRDSSRFSIVRVVKRVGNETTYFSAPPDDAPQSIKEKFAALNAPQPDPEAIREAKVQEGYRQAERDKKERASILGTILGK
jgi:hypothetical protein